MKFPVLQVCGLNVLFSVTVLLLLFAVPGVGQNKTCGLTLKVVDADGKKEIADAYAEAYATEVSTAFYAYPEGSNHTFEDLESGYYHLTVQKRGYKISKYLQHLDCSKVDIKNQEPIMVPLHEGNISEREDVTPRTKVATSDSDRFARVGKQLSLEDVARLSNYLNYIAAELGKASYPPAARAVKAAGLVTVHVIVNEAGEIESAVAWTGHPLLRAAAKQAAEKSKFDPVLVRNKPIKVQGFIVYNFVP